MTELTQAQIDQAQREFYTPAGKKMGVFKVSNTSLYRLGFTDGGQLPKKYAGMYTDPTRADDDIRKYLKELWDEHLRPKANTGPKRGARKDNSSDENSEHATA